MGRRILNEALRTIVNAEKRGFASAQLQPISNTISSFLSIMKHRGYVKNFEVHDPHRVGKIKVELLGRINDCRAITYRQDIKAHEIENYRLRTLPTQQAVSCLLTQQFIDTLLHGHTNWDTNWNDTDTDCRHRWGKIYQRHPRQFNGGACNK